MMNGVGNSRWPLQILNTEAEAKDAIFMAEVENEILGAGGSSD